MSFFIPDNMDTEMELDKSLKVKNVDVPGRVLIGSTCSFLVHVAIVIAWLKLEFV